MFKKVEYAGFADDSELRAKAEHLNHVLAGEVHRWRDDVEVRWSPSKLDESHQDGLRLSLSLTLPNGISESNSGTVSTEEMTDKFRRASRCGRIWYDLLGGLVRQIDSRVQTSILEPETAGA